MSRLRAFSSPDLVPSGSGSISSPTKTNEHQPHEDSGLEGITTNVKLLLKLVQDHNEATSKHRDEWKAQRVNTMMTILDDLKTRIHKAQQQSSSGKKELRRCNTDLKPRHDPNKIPMKPPQNNDSDDIQKLRKELSASMAARKSLQMMCSSLGKEKEIMAIELSRKAHELSGMEELISDLKAQNEKLLKKVQNCAVEHNIEKKGGDGDDQGDNDVSLQGRRNKELSEQLLKSIDGYRSLKRRYKDAQEENGTIRQVLQDFAEEGSQRLTELQEKITGSEEVNLEDEISDLEKLFQRLGLKISNHADKK